MFFCKEVCSDGDILKDGKLGQVAGRFGSLQCESWRQIL